MIYLDSAAVVKLAHAEAESPALRAWLDERAETGWVSSVLIEIESFRALARDVPDAVSRLPAVLDQMELIGLDPPIRVLAQTVRPATVRSLDAIHLGTALHTRATLTSFVTYHKRLLARSQQRASQSIHPHNPENDQLRALLTGLQPPFPRAWRFKAGRPGGAPAAACLTGRSGRLGRCR